MHADPSAVCGRASTKERLEKGIEMLVERKNILLAKMALSNLKFD
jgi:hypothetical protein